MQKVINHPTYGQIIYEESAWTGKKTLTVNGTVANKIAKNIFSLNGMQIVIKGSFYTKITMTINNEVITVVESTKWYEWVLSVISVVFVIVWGNSIELCKIFPVLGSAVGYALGSGSATYSMVCGGIGGAICGVCVVLSLIYMKKASKPLNKVLIGLGFTAIAILINFLLALVLIAPYM